VKIQADGFIQLATADQRLILRLGIVFIPVAAITMAYLIICKKYTIDEKRYEEIVRELDSRKARTQGR